MVIFHRLPVIAQLIIQAGQLIIGVEVQRIRFEHFLKTTLRFRNLSEVDGCTGNRIQSIYIRRVHRQTMAETLVCFLIPEHAFISLADSRHSNIVGRVCRRKTIGQGNHLRKLLSVNQFL